jgi:hypothetical protein
MINFIIILGSILGVYSNVFNIVKYGLFLGNGWVNIA